MNLFVSSRKKKMLKAQKELDYLFSDEKPYCDWQNIFGVEYTLAVFNRAYKTLDAGYKCGFSDFHVYGKKHGIISVTLKSEKHQKGLDITFAVSPTRLIPIKVIYYYGVGSRVLDQRFVSEKDLLEKLLVAKSIDELMAFIDAVI